MQLEISTSREFRDGIQDFRSARNSANSGNDGLGVLSDLFEEEVDSGRRTEGSFNIESGLVPPEVAGPVLWATQELTINAGTHGLVGGIVPPSEFSNEQSELFRNSLQLACKAAVDANVDPITISVDFNPDLMSGEVVVTHAVIPGLSSPPVDLLHLGPRDRTDATRSRMGGVENITKGPIALSFERAGCPVTGLEVHEHPSPEPDGVGTREFRLTFGS